MTTARRWRTLAPAALVVLAVAILAPTAGAATMPSQTAAGGAAQGASTNAAAERQMVQAQLHELGLSQQQAAERMQLLTDQEVHVLAAELESIRAGGAGQQTFSLEQVLLIAILVLLLAD